MILPYSSRERDALKLIYISTIMWTLISGGFTSPPGTELQNVPHDITEDQLLNTAMVVVNDRTVPLAVFFEMDPRMRYRPVYGHLFKYLTSDSPMPINFPPADLDSRCLGGSYVNRKLISDIRPPTASTSREFPDTATLIARDLANYVSTRRDSIPITMIIGEPGTGKSTTLLKIQHELINLVPSCWCIKVDLSLIRQLARDYDTALTYHSIIEEFLPPGHSVLMENVLIVNPHKIVVLFDGVDTIPEKYMPNFVELVADWTNVGIVAVTTGRRYNINMFNKLNVHRITYTIPELLIHEAEAMLNNIWSAEINSMDLFSGNRETVHNHLDDYTTVFTHVLYKTPIPRQPSMLLTVANLLSSRDQSVEMSFPVDYATYVFTPNPPLSRLRQALEAHHNKQFYLVSKKVLYEPLFNTEHHKRLTADVPNYGSLAVYQLITENEDVSTANNLLGPILSEVNEAKLALASLREENKFFTITEGGIEFTHPEYQRYLAMDYITTKLIHKNDDPRVLKLVLQFFINPNYRYLLEFACGEDWSPLIDHINQNDHLVSLLDNVIGSGFDLLYRHIHSRLLANDRLSKVQDYFWGNHMVLLGPNRAFGMLQTGDDDLLTSASTAGALSNLLEALYHYDMINTINALHASNIVTTKNVESQKILRIAMTQQWPNLILSTYAMNFIRATKKVHLDLNGLLYDVINQVGPGSEEIAIYLRDQGAKPSVKMTNGQTLLHAAVKWSDATFVRFVIEKLKQLPTDRADNNGRTVFAAALDANPTPSGSNSNWWQMMEYLVSTVHLRPFPSASSLPNDLFKIPFRDFKSPWLHFMTGWHHIILPGADIDSGYNANEVTVKIITETDPRNGHFRRLAQAIPSHLWRISPQTLQLRRNSLLHTLYSKIDDPTQIEVLINYGGSSELSDSDHYFYRAAVNSCYRRYKNHMSSETYIRLFTTLANNAIGRDDEKVMLYATTNPIMEVLTESLRTQVYDVIKLLESSSKIGSGQVSLLWTLTSRRPVEFDHIEFATRLEHHVHLPALPDSVIRTHYSDPALCLPRRSRRALTMPKICLYGWNEVDRVSSEDHGRDPTKIKIDTDKFVKYLAASESSDISKSRQLVNLVQYLENRATPASILSGKSQMLVKDILKHGSLTDYRKYQQNINAINDPKFSSDKMSLHTRFPSQTVALYAITGLSLVRSAFAAMDACSEHRNNSGCLFASSALAVTALQIPASYLASRYVPWITDSFSTTALEMLPSRAPKFLRENLQLMRTTTGMKIAGRAVGFAIGLPGLGFELYTVAHLSMMVDLCNRGDSKCTSKDRLESVIMLTFSCTSFVIGIFTLMATGVGIWIGVAFGLAIEIFQSIALGINDVIYYRQRYGTRFNENVRLFASRIGFIPSLRDVEDLARNSEWMNILEEKAASFLGASDAATVGYAVGVGRTVLNGVQASSGSIDLNSESVENTRKLSRVLPRPRSMTKSLCLPRQRNITLYNDVNYATHMPSIFTHSAVHRCRNSFVLGHRIHLQNTSSLSTVVYDMALINRGEVIASNTYNNLFLVHGGAALIKGSINTTNIYRMLDDSFQGGIVLQAKSQNTLDLTALVSPTVAFLYNPKWKMGSIQMVGSQQSSFTIATRDSIAPELHVVGRTGQPEIYECNRSQKLVTPAHFTIDGSGGSATQMDRIVDCSIAIVRPFTSVFGSEDPNTTRMVFVPLNYSSPSRHPGMKSSRAVIYPLQSKFMVTFTGRPLLIGTHEIKYYNSNKTLSWEFSDGPLSTMTLAIESYRAPHLTDDRPVFDDRVVNCMFVDKFTNAIIYPVLDLLDNKTDVISVRHLDVVSWINSSRLAHVVSQYQKIKANIADKFIVHKLIDSTTGKSFSFGSAAGDRFYADANTTFIFGSDGSDIYSFNSLSSACVWIDNQAYDNTTDTIVVSADMCDSLVASMGSEDSQSTRGSDADITITCFRESSSSSPYTKIILRDYVFGLHARHLQIYWQDNLYVPLVRRRREGLYLDGDYTAELVLVFSFDDWTNTMVTPTSEDSCIVVKTSSDVTNPLVTYRFNSSMVLTRQYSDNLRPSFILFEDFFLDTSISFDWRNLTVFEVHDRFDSVDNARVLSARDLQSLLVTSDSKQDDFIVEYSVNMSDVAEKTVIISHNNESTAYKKLGILRLLNVRPGDLRASWSKNTASLQFCTLNNTCVHVQNWCTAASHRLYRIDFVISLDQPTLVVRGLDKLHCHESKNNRRRSLLIKKLNDMLTRAEQTRLLSAANEESDESRLITCLGINLASTFINSSIPQLFGFQNEFEEMSFVRDNCQPLYSQVRLYQLTLGTFQTALENKIKKYFIFWPKHATHPSIINFRKQLQTLDDCSWKKYLISMHSLVKN